MHTFGTFKLTKRIKVSCSQGAILVRCPGVMIKLADALGLFTASPVLLRISFSQASSGSVIELLGWLMCWRSTFGFHKSRKFSFILLIFLSIICPCHGAVDS